MAYKYGLLCRTHVSLISCNNKGTITDNTDIPLMGNRFLTLNTVIRVNQIEVTRDKNVGTDERNKHTPEKLIRFREAIEKGFPGSRITWSFSWLSLNDTTNNYRLIRELVVGYHYRYGDDSVPRSQTAAILFSGAAQKMRDGPSEPVYRHRLQTTLCRIN